VTDTHAHRHAHRQIKIAQTPHLQFRAIWCHKNGFMNKALRVFQNPSDLRGEPSKGSKNIFWDMRLFQNASICSVVPWWCTLCYHCCSARCLPVVLTSGRATSSGGAALATSLLRSGKDCAGAGYTWNKWRREMILRPQWILCGGTKWFSAPNICRGTQPMSAPT